MKEFLINMLDFIYMKTTIRENVVVEQDRYGGEDIFIKTASIEKRPRLFFRVLGLTGGIDSYVKVFK